MIYYFLISYLFIIIFILFILFPLADYYEIPCLSVLLKKTKLTSSILFKLICTFIGLLFWIYSLIFILWLFYKFMSLITFESYLIIFSPHEETNNVAVTSVLHSNVNNRALIYTTSAVLLGSLIGMKCGRIIRPYFREMVNYNGKIVRLPLANSSNPMHQAWVDSKAAAVGSGGIYAIASVLYNILEKGMPAQEACQAVFINDLTEDTYNIVKECITDGVFFKKKE